MFVLFDYVDQAHAYGPAHTKWGDSSVMFDDALATSEAERLRLVRVVTIAAEDMHALEYLACRKRVAPASTPAAPASS